VCPNRDTLRSQFCHCAASLSVHTYTEVAAASLGGVITATLLSVWPVDDLNIMQHVTAY
jgi:hypothetical protein